MKLEKNTSNKNGLIKNDVVTDVSKIINEAEIAAYKSLDNILVKRNWLIGKRIYEEELNGTRSENYGLEIINYLSSKLTEIYGKGYSQSYLYSYYRFYKLYPNIFDDNVRNKKTLLSWTHYLLLIRIEDEDARNWYEIETRNSAWSFRTLKRNIKSRYYYRIVQQGLNYEAKNTNNSETTYNYLKNPYILEFLGFNKTDSFLETDIEETIILNLQSFLIELGKGFAFVGRQYHIHTIKRDYYIDLVFYNYHLKCFVIIDLKTEKITHNDVGQMDMYVRMFNELVRSKDDNPTLGIVLCADTDEDVARYSILNDSDNIFASKYKLYLPTEEELKEEINKEKELFYLCHKEKITKKQSKNPVKPR